ncbi:DUF6087 family protein [Streptomyces sp. NPDC004838]
MNDEPLSDWVKRRDARIGRLRAVPIVGRGEPRGAHLRPDAPRAVERWNGHAWELHTIARNLAEARRLLHPEPHCPETAPETVRPTAEGEVDPADGGTDPGPGTGRHRKRGAPRPDPR